MQCASPLSVLPTGVEMFQKGHNHSFFNSKALAPSARPLSEATEIYDTDFEDDLSETENNSARRSVESFGRQSDTTISTYDEVPTPRSERYSGFGLASKETKPVEGPKGPHLFRASQDASQDIYIDLSMSLSPLVSPQEPTKRFEPFPSSSPNPVSQERHFSTLPKAVAQLDTAEVRSWSPQQVASWMYASGFEESVVEKFESNDISGAILVDLQFEDLKELDIQSFGKRHRLWTEIHSLRGNAGLSPTPTPLSGLERPATGMSGRNTPRSRSHSHDNCTSPEDEHASSPSPRRRRRNDRRLGADDIISPAESVSIVAIEQLLPKPHKCSKGENCSKWRKQQRQLARLAEEIPISPENSRRVLVTPVTAEHPMRPTSEAVPSVVASSDVLGPGQYPEFRLEEQKLRVLESRDPQENVKQFLNFQHLRRPVDEPATPPLDLFPPLHPPEETPAAHGALRNLPRLSIPPERVASANGQRTVTRSTFVPSRSVTPSNVYRHGTPFSEMDVPVTAIQLGPVARDASQSVPPNMQYRNDVEPGPRSSSRNALRRPSLPPMTRVDEHAVLSPSNSDPASHRSAGVTPSDINYAGWMKKRKTKFLRHEWHENHFTLKGTQLAMHRDERTVAALESIDVDDYAIACSSLASSGKLGAAFKSLKLASTNGKKKDNNDVSAFAFQLVPAIEKKGPRSAASSKTHHFAVHTRDERIDWMRELMLAKALKQKGEGYEVNVNGNMI